jgi:hypothetical protein
MCSNLEIQNRWEVLTRKEPWPGMDPVQVAFAVRDGRRLDIPEFCPKDLAVLMKTCWLDDPMQRCHFSFCSFPLQAKLTNNPQNNRPTMDEIYARLDELEKQYFPNKSPNPSRVFLPTQQTYGPISTVSQTSLEIYGLGQNASGEPHPTNYSSRQPLQPNRSDYGQLRLDG